MAYEAEGDKVYVVQEGDAGRELFLTVHPTDTGGTMTVEEQAAQIARVFNDTLSVKAVMKFAS